MTFDSVLPRKELGGKCYFDVTGGRFAWKKFLQKTGAKLLDGWQLRYIYFIDPSYRQRLTVPEIPFSRIDEMGAGMYRGKKTAAELVPNSQLTKAQNIAT